ncbi:MAG: AAA family ATPase [Lepagella sp.]
MIRVDSEFAGFRIDGMLACRHRGEREVYHALDKDGHDVVLIVFDLRSSRYAVKGSARKRHLDFIQEANFYKAYASKTWNMDVSNLPEYRGSGIECYRHHRYGWVALEYVEGNTLDYEIRRRGRLPIRDAVTIAQRVSAAAISSAQFTEGGGHYNISTDNIIVCYDGDELVDVRLIGFANIGKSYRGNSSIDGKSLDKRFRAPETQKGIFSYRSDIYSIGMILLLMLTGYPEEIESEGRKIASREMTADMISLSSLDFSISLWTIADKMLPKALRVILRKATETSPNSRFSAFEQFCDFLSRVSTKDADANSEVSFNGEKTMMGGTPSEDGDNGSKRHSLDEVAGMNELKELFRRDFIRIVQNPQIAKAYGIKPSNCTLLYGPQGCGKTFIAEKAAQESGLTYKVVNPSELGSTFIHGSQKKIAELFEEAEEKGPMILIFDEFDALVPKRDEDLSSNQANEVNEMLSQLNNCASKGIYVLATTNRPALIDPAILRKGRVDRTVYVSLPDLKAREELFRLEIEKRPKEDIDYELLSRATENYTGSDISFIVEESARLCFEETLERKTEELIPLSMSRLLEVIRKTNPSVSEAQRKEYLELKAKMEETESSRQRKKVGFAV